MILAAVSIGRAVAGPAHAHMHRHVHEKRSVDWAALDWDAMGIDWTSAWAAGQHTSTSAAPAVAATTPAAAVVQAATTTAAAAATTSASSSIGGVFDEVATLFEDLVGLANGLTSFGASAIGSGTLVDAIGNIGNPQGSNMMKVSSTAGQDFTANFINTSDDDITVALWNKAYSTTGAVADADPNLGASMAPTIPTLTFALKPGGNQIVAFLDETIIAFAQATSAINEAGQFATTWGECKFFADGSGYDMSAIQNANGNNYNMSLCSEEAPECCSDPTQNYWLTADDAVGNSDGSCYIAQSTATLTVKMGGTIS